MFEGGRGAGEERGGKVGCRGRSEMDGGGRGCAYQKDSTFEQTQKAPPPPPPPPVHVTFALAPVLQVREQLLHFRHPATADQITLGDYVPGEGLDVCAAIKILKLDPIRIITVEGLSAMKEPPTFAMPFENCHVCSLPGIHNAKAEECTTPYMRQIIKINIGAGGLHGNQVC